LYTTHLRNEADLLLDAINEAITIGFEGIVPVQISHHKAASRNNWGKVSQSLALIEEAIAHGLDITCDQYPYTAASTNLAAITPDAFRKDLLCGIGYVDAPDVLISSAPKNRKYEGKTLQDLCEVWGVDTETAAQKVLKEGNVMVILNLMSGSDVCTVMKHRSTMIGSDGIFSETGMPHPRLYGTFARVLGHYVREKNLFPLEEGIYKMTGSPAKKFNLEKRGLIQEGFFADLVLFDPKIIADQATYEDPRKFPIGIHYVLVNGTIVVNNGQHTQKRPGQVLRRREAPPK
jgi:N-acyl-D-amino-acid deacylase